MAQNKNICPRCGKDKFYHVRRNKLLCGSCRYEWDPDRLPLRLKRDKWSAILRHFIDNNTSNYIARETHIERRRVLRALIVLRKAIKYYTLTILDSRIKAVLDGVSAAFSLEKTTQAPLFVFVHQRKGIYATAVSGEGKSRLLKELGNAPVSFSIVRREVGRGSPVCVYSHQVCKFTTEKQKATLTRFWEYLVEHFIGRGGIRLNRLHFYLAEYAWKFNHRDLSKGERLKLLLGLLKDQVKRR